VRLVWAVPVVLAALAVFVVVYVRLAPSDPAVWHRDPETVPDPATPNFARADLVLPLPLPQVAERIEAIARAEGAARLAGDAGMSTWLTRSPLMRYPDYTTIRLVRTDAGTRLTALARARFGYGDQGMNRARLDRWLAALAGG
jgi:hypothetical protein